MHLLVNRVEGMGRSLRQLGAARWPWGVVGVLLAIEACMETGGGYQRMAWWYRTFGLTRWNDLHGRLWQLLTYALLHGSWTHALVNSLCLLLLGARIEHAAGAGVALRAMLWGVLGGAIGHLLLAAPDRYTLLVGSSGGVFGLMLLTTTLGPESRMWPLPVSGRVVGFLLIATSLVLTLLDPLFGLPGFSMAGSWLTSRGFGSLWTISHACHFGGGMAGWAYGRWLLRPRVTLESLRRDRAKRER